MNIQTLKKSVIIMKPEEEIKQELVEPDSNPGSFPAAQNTEPGHCQVTRKELHRRWLRYRPLHCQQTPIIPGYRGDTGYILQYPEIGFTLHQADTRYIPHQEDTRYTLHKADTRFTQHQADTRYTPDHPEIGYSLYQPSIQHPLLISRGTPHA